MKSLKDKERFKMNYIGKDKSMGFPTKDVKEAVSDFIELELASMSVNNGDIKPELFFEKKIVKKYKLKDWDLTTIELFKIVFGDFNK